MNHQELIGKARSQLALLVEQGGHWYEKSGADRLVRHPRFQQGREWAKTLGFGNRSVQAVGAALVVGTLYVVAAQPFAGSEPEARAVVAERLAPVGTVTIDPSASQLADQRDPDRAPAAAIN